MMPQNYFWSYRLRRFTSSKRGQTFVSYVFVVAIPIETFLPGIPQWPTFRPLRQSPTSVSSHAVAITYTMVDNATAYEIEGKAFVITLITILLINGGLLLKWLVHSKAMQPNLPTKFVIGKRLYVTSRILSPEICKQCSCVKCWRT